MPSTSVPDGARHPVRRGVRALAVAAIALGLSVGLAAGGAAQQQDPVWVVPIEGDIDLGLAPFLDRTLGEAEAEDAAAAILVIDTPGGRLDAVLQMRDTLLATPVPTIAYVDRTAFSAGALIALAADEIHFAPGGVMGAATPVVAGTPDDTRTADPKVVSAVRSTFAATAEQRDRDPTVAEAMVDESVAVDGLSEPGSLLTLTASDAEAVGYSEGLAPDRDALLASLDLDGHPVVEVEPSLAERTVRLITNPVLASILVTIGVLLVVGELLLGAFGVASLAGLALLGTFFYGHLLAGLAGWEDVVLVGVGIVLILVELLVVPGFGVPGVLGLASVLGGSYLAMLGRDLDFVSASQMLSTAGTIGLVFVAIVVGLVALLTLLGRRRGNGTARPGTASSPGRGWLRWFGDGDVLEREPSPQAATTPEDVAREGAIGVALTDLRPAGVATFEGHRVDVVTEGDYLVAGERVLVLRAERYRHVVRRAPDEDPLRS